MLTFNLSLGVPKITLNNVIYSSDPKYANASAIIWQQNEKSYLNLTMETFEDLEKMIITVKWGFKTSKNSDSEISLMNTKINSCKLSEGNRGNPLVRIVMDPFDRCSDFNFTCPFTKKKFNFFNYSPNEKLLIPIPTAGPFACLFYLNWSINL
ncbi:CLUMA_CG003126, isoform A [Clunio marinus]|uniref:CLUMA_CG003126, isoform A n=1 Tax=Clunio marinus TaxID=568069 RepID=A0A1J1HN42_9DIPT|nr:CLUMA_CG003126, isoform A [Clunio marinus]